MRNLLYATACMPEPPFAVGESSTVLIRDPTEILNQYNMRRKLRTVVGDLIIIFRH